MKLHQIDTSFFQWKLTTGQLRKGLHLSLKTKDGQTAQGEAAPLPSWNRESLEDVSRQLEAFKPVLLEKDWTVETLSGKLFELNLLPSLEFALESALLDLLSPILLKKPTVSALLMGSKAEILHQAYLRATEGYVSAKLKVGGMPLDHARELIEQLKEIFRLRIDVNRAWETADALAFFENYPLEAFDYIEEPFKNPHDLKLFTHPLAVDESFPHPLTLADLEKLPALKTVVFKPTLQGGIVRCTALQDWAAPHKISLVLSSAFESDLGLKQIQAMAQRLDIKIPLGLGTVHYLQN